jgi:superoxide reductase
MDKRSFMRLGIIGSTAGVILPKSVYAAAMDMGLNSKFAGGVYQTLEAYGRWTKELAGLHLPHLEKQMSGGATHLHVASHHPMVGYKHYIIKHELLNADFHFMHEHSYNPAVDKAPASQFDLGSYRGAVYVMTICNIHDVWLNMIEV